MYHSILKTNIDEDKKKQIIDTCVKVLNEYLKDETMVSDIEKYF